jgi:glycosyltransferase involved in cell wall biosynthesis
MTPKITIVTPNYNGAKYLEETIQSVLNQGYPNLEYIIIDGGSTDGSVDIIKKYESRLAYWVSEPDAGLYHAIQKGFERSTGDIMAWINSDDKYHRGAFSIVTELFNQFPQIEWLQGIPSIYDEQGRTVMVDHFRAWCKADIYSGRYQWIQQESTFWRRSLWDKAGAMLDTRLKYAADFELWLRFFRHAELYSLKALLSGFRFRSANQISQDFHLEYQQEVLDAIKNEVESLPADYRIKLQAIAQFNQKMKTLTNRVARSWYFRRNYKRVQQFEKELFQYPQKMGFDRATQLFYLHD